MTIILLEKGRATRLSSPPAVCPDRRKPPL